jgi:hypothetical protein
MIFMLTFFTINPLPPVHAASFGGTVTGSTGSGDADKKVTVTNAPNQSTLKLYSSSGGAPVSTVTITGTTHIFNVTDFGKYYVTSTVSQKDADGNDVDIESSPSSTVEVRPGAVTISQEDVGSDEILVTNAIPGAELILYNDRTGYVPRTTTADGNNKGIFTRVPPGLNYKALQKINGVEGPLSSETINILPKSVQVTASETAGPANNQGTISVLESTPGNTIRLWDKDRKLIDSKTADSQGGHVFTGLKAGTYYITHLQNGAESKEVKVEIGDAEAPVITLIGSSEVRIVIGETYSDLGAIATDNIDDSATLTSKIVVNNPISAESQPGIYTITYNVTDSSGNKAIEVTRKVMIAPKKVGLTPVHTNDATDPTPKDGPNGQMKVEQVYPGAILYLYQDPNGELIRTITDANNQSYTINNVPVGKDYYVIQEFHNDNGTVVESEPSDRKEIKDTTKPVLTLNGANPINLVMGDNYIEYGATATDNVDMPEEINPKIEITGTVNIHVPGVYTITYNVKDKAGNAATPITRTVNVSPAAVIAIGSTADFGEVGVKNALPNALLKLYKSNGDDKINGVEYIYQLTQGETTHTFKNVPPGSYYVTQQAGGFWSTPSNVVDVVDIDRPYITLLGPERLMFTWGENKDPYYSSLNIFSDPGATAYDYIEGDLSGKITKTTMPDIGSGPSLQVTAPGSYKISYSVTAARGTKADDKHRTIIVAPPMIKKEDLTSEAGKSSIEVKGTFPNATTVVNLYDTYDQLIESKPVNSIPMEFTDVPAGLGYYVTQTVNGIESAPSEPVDVTIFEEAANAALIMTFEFKDLNASGAIDHEAGTIAVTVPKDTNVTKLKASFTGTGQVIVRGATQTSGLTEQNFTNSVLYKVFSSDGKASREYTVQVTKSTFSTNTWSDTVKKNESFSSKEKVITLSPTEKAIASEKGVSFLATDRAIHVPAVNVKEANRASLTVSRPTSIVKLTDPAWGITIQNAMELNWDSSTTSFLQPIEIEMPNPDKKALAKLVREDGKLYAMIQQNELVGNNIVGLVTEPGTYALINDIAKPNIFPSTQNGDTVYRLWSGDTDAQIYYTTNSSNISFDRSARKSSFDSYSLNGTPSDLSKWTLYKKDERISIPNGELYAFTMKDQMISQISMIDTKTEITWNDDIPTYPTHKVLSVTFSSKVDKKALYSGSIYVIDDATGKPVPTTLSLSADNKTISVIPKTAYTSNKQYTLYIERQIKGNTTRNEFLKQPLTRTFRVK